MAQESSRRTGQGNTVKAIDDGSVDEVFSRLEKVLESHSEEGDWQLDYLSNHKRRYIRTIDIIQQQGTGTKLLEMGAIPGHLAYLCSELGYDVSIVDVQPDRIALPIQSAVSNVKKCDIEQESLPFEDNSFDIVLLAEVFEHLRVNPLHALREARRVLVDDGKLILTTPNLYFLERVRQFLGFQDGIMWGSPADSFETLESKGHMGHVRVHTLSEVVDTVRRVGYDVIETEYRMMEWDHWEPENVDGVSEYLRTTIARGLTRAIPRLRKTVVVIAVPDSE